MDPSLDWLLTCDEPWTRYRALVDLLRLGGEDSEVLAARRELLLDLRIHGLIGAASGWGQAPIRRHNDAGHALAALAVLADFGLCAADPEIAPVIESVLAHQSTEGAFQSVLNIAPAYGGTGEDQWAWVLCDAPTLLYSLLAMGLGRDARVQRAVVHLVGLATDVGWKCVCAPELGKFRGPGRKDDPCPIATLLALRALAQVPALVDSPAARAGTELLLWHWQHRAERKFYLFGIGTDFRRLKYPFVWYDVLHVADVLSRFHFVHADPRFLEMVGAVSAQADSAGRCAPGSMYQSWKGWCFADKKAPSPWLTFLVLRIVDRVQHLP
jgi:hypothetical protein